MRLTKNAPEKHNRRPALWSRPLACALLFSLISTAQQRPAAPTPAQDAAADVTFSSNTQLVIETVTVRDKSGKSVEGLTAKDFTITEDGAPQAIKFFEY